MWFNNFVLCTTVRWGTWCCYAVWTDISIYMCVHIHNSAFCACVFAPVYDVCVRGCVWFLYNIPNLSNLGPRCEALLFSRRSSWATKTVVHFGNRLKLWTSMKLTLSFGWASSGCGRGHGMWMWELTWTWTWEWEWSHLPCQERANSSEGRQAAKTI